MKSLKFYSTGATLLPNDQNSLSCDTITATATTTTTTTTTTITTTTTTTTTTTALYPVGTGALCLCVLRPDHETDHLRMKIYFQPAWRGAHI
jgi:hypothetical protein